MTARQQRRLEQKRARKAAKKGQNCTPEQPQVLPPAHPISHAKLLANRANAQLSTGAITTVGKQTVSQNAPPRTHRKIPSSSR
jgi:hypothetical protein